MLVLNLPFKALMFLTLMRPSLVLFLVLWLKLVKDFLKVDRKSGSAGMPRPSSYAVFCLKKKSQRAGLLEGFGRLDGQTFGSNHGCIWIVADTGSNVCAGQKCRFGRKQRDVARWCATSSCYVFCPI